MGGLLDKELDVAVKPKSYSPQLSVHVENRYKWCP